MAKSLTHAGVVVFRKVDNRILYLVVSSSDGANWVLPKGHIDPGETPEIAALRELAEEAGVVGAIAHRLSVQHFQKSGKEVSLQYFLIRELGSTETTEKRSLRWEDERTAFQLLTFEEARSALLEGAEAVQLLDIEDRT